MNLVEDVKKKMEDEHKGDPSFKKCGGSSSLVNSEEASGKVDSEKIDWVGWLAWAGHVIFIIFLVIVPFTNNQEWLKYHADAVFFLVVKWFILNKCTLVKFEKMIRGVSTEESLVYRFLEPLVDLRHKKAYWMPLVILGGISFYKWRSMAGGTVFEEWFG